MECCFSFRERPTSGSRALSTGQSGTAPNCVGFRLRVAWRRPSVLTSGLSRAVLGTARARPRVRKPLSRYVKGSSREVEMPGRGEAGW